MRQCNVGLGLRELGGLLAGHARRLGRYQAALYGLGHALLAHVSGVWPKHSLLYQARLARAC